MKYFGKCFLRAQIHCVLEIAKVEPHNTDGLANVTQVVLASREWRYHGEQLRLGTVRNHERPLVKVQPQLQLMAQDWRGHAKELRLGTIKGAYERLLVKPSCSEKPQHVRNASTMGWSPGRAAAMRWSQPDPGVLQRGRAGNVTRDLWKGQTIMCGSQTWEQEI